jgi:hypothetical protein
LYDPLWVLCVDCLDTLLRFWVTVLVSHAHGTFCTVSFTRLRLEALRGVFHMGSEKAPYVQHTSVSFCRRFEVAVACIAISSLGNTSTRSAYL